MRSVKAVVSDIWKRSHQVDMDSALTYQKVIKGAVESQCNGAEGKRRIEGSVQVSAHLPHPRSAKHQAA